MTPTLNHRIREYLSSHNQRVTAGQVAEWINRDGFKAKKEVIHSRLSSMVAKGVVSKSYKTHIGVTEYWIPKIHVIPAGWGYLPGSGPEVA